MRYKKDKPSTSRGINQYQLPESKKSRTIKEITSELEGLQYREFFSGFDEESVEHFIKQYAIKKSQYLRYAPEYIRSSEEAISTEHADALELLLEIQQKKLFNLQCLWRAEKIILPGVDICFDFSYWEKNIAACPFIDPVTEEEKDLYIEYIHSDFFSEINPLISWQDYRGFLKESDEEGHVPLPAWYTYYDSRMGTDELMNYPDIRGEKEKYYTCAPKPGHNCFAAMEQQAKPRLDIFAPGVLQLFIQKFENRKLMDLCIVYETELKKQNEYGVVETAIDILKKANVHIPIEAAADWQTAIIHAAWKYERRELEKSINLVYNEYIMRKSLGISGLAGKWAIQEELYTIMLKTRKDAILSARIKAGEPANFDF